MISFEGAVYDGEWKQDKWSGHGNNSADRLTYNMDCRDVCVSRKRHVCGGFCQYETTWKREIGFSFRKYI